MDQHLTKLCLTGVVAVALLALGGTLLNPFIRQALAQGFECDEGKTVLILVLPNGTKKSICVPADVVEGIENAGDNAPFDFTTQKTVFVTRGGFSPAPMTEAFDLTSTLAGTGLEAGDLICQRLADDAVVGGTYKAWLSDSVEAAAKWLNHAGVPYMRAGGAIIANDWADIAGGSLGLAINVDEVGVVDDTRGISAWVWTGAGTVGLEDDRATEWCDVWSSVNPLGATGGVRSGVDRRGADRVSVPCFRDARLYCFEQ